MRETRPPPRSRRWWHRALLPLGLLLMVAAVPVGLIPGPGGIFVFAAGAAIALKGSVRAKRLYVRLARRFPRIGRLVDKGLRRHRHAASAAPRA